MSGSESENNDVDHMNKQEGVLMPTSQEDVEVKALHPSVPFNGSNQGKRYLTNVIVRYISVF